MYPFRNGVGSPPGYQNPQAISYNGHQATQQSPHSQSWSAGPPYESETVAQGGLHVNPVAVASYQPCYNCGSMDHWAQNCPEPRRAVPAGEMTNQRPFKRQRTSGPVVTKYHVPLTSTDQLPCNHPLHVPRRGFTHPPVRQSSQQHRSQWTRPSANSNPHGPLQQHNWPSSPPSSRQVRQWNSEAWPTSNDANCSQPANPKSPVGSDTKQKGSPLWNHMHRLSPALASPGRRGSLERLPEKVPRGFSTGERALTLSQQGKGNQFKHVEASKSDVQGEQAEESWWEELRALDYPNRFYDSKNIVSHPANPVAEPLPSIMTNRNFMVRLPIAASVPAGTPVSKYFRNLNVEDFMRNYFTDSRVKEDGDPALAAFSDDFGAISKAELVARRGKMVLTEEDVGNGDEELDENVINESGTSDEVREFGDISSLNADVPPTPCQSQEPDEERQAREQEEKLAALGVTGFAKPVRTSVRRFVFSAAPASSEDPGTFLTSGFTPLHDARGVSLWSSENAMGNGYSSNALPDHQPKPFSDADWEGYAGKGSPPGSYQHAGSLQTPPASACHDTYFDNTENRARRFSGYGAQSTLTNSPASSIGVRGDKYRSPLDDRSDQGHSPKRSVRKLSVEVEEGPRRQKDESHQNNKRKAPKVAAAYSRRW